MVPAIQTLPPLIYPVLLTPASILSTLWEALILSSVKSDWFLAFPVPKAYFYPKPQLKSLLRLVNATECIGPQAILVTTSSCPSRNTGFSSSSSLLVIGLIPCKLVILASSGRSSLDLRCLRLHSLRVSAKKLALGFLVPPGRRQCTRTGFFLSSVVPSPSCPLRLSPNEYNYPLELCTKVW